VVTTWITTSAPMKSAILTGKTAQIMTNPCIVQVEQDSLPASMQLQVLLQRKKLLHIMLAGHRYHMQILATTFTF